MSSSQIRHAAPANLVNSTSSTSAQVFNLVSNSAVPATVAAPGHLVLEGKTFTVRAEGNVLTAGNYTVLATLLAAVAIPAVPLTASNWTAIAYGTARAVNTIYAPWRIEAKLQFDSNGGIMHGCFEQEINALYDVWATLRSTITGINGTNASITQGVTAVTFTEPAVNFAIALTMGTAGVNIGNLVNFELGF